MKVEPTTVLLDLIRRNSTSCMPGETKQGQSISILKYIVSKYVSHNDWVYLGTIRYSKHSRFEGLNFFSL